ncbi:MAG: HAD family hydrolase [Gemmatimonadota bacterium]
MTFRKLVLFDIDGTLLHTRGAGRRAITQALLGDVADPGGFHRVRFDGKTDPQIMVELLEAGGVPGPHPPERITAACRRYLEHLERELSGGMARTTVLPGVPDLLDQLEAEAGVLLGLVTGNLAVGAALKLRSGGIDPDRFRVGAFGSDSAHRPDLPPIAAERAVPHVGRRPSGPEIVIIGDTPADMTCGAALGARAIGVTTGSYAADELHAAGAFAVFGDLSATAEVVEAILAP